MLKFVLLSVLCGASLAMNVEKTAEDLNLIARSCCDKTGCTQTDECKKPSKAEGVCVSDVTACKTLKKDFYQANISQCQGSCKCMMKCRAKPECYNIGGKCVRRGVACDTGYVEKQCGCKTKNNCSCCVPTAMAGSLTC